MRTPYTPRRSAPEIEYSIFGVWILSIENSFLESKKRKVRFGVKNPESELDVVSVWAYFSQNKDKTMFCTFSRLLKLIIIQWEGENYTYVHIWFDLMKFVDESIDLETKQN